MRRPSLRRSAGLLMVLALLTISPGAHPEVTSGPSLSADRFGTAAAAALTAFPDGATTAVIASGEGFADALGAAPLADAVDGPILLTGRDAVPEATAAALTALGVTHVLVVGGTAAVSDAAVGTLSAGRAVTRIDGPAPAVSVVEVFFANDALGDPCGTVFPLPRVVATDAPLRPTLEALLAGPSAAEQAAGYGGWFSTATAGALRSVRVEGGVAHVDLADLRTVIPNASTSCGSAGLLAQLDRTVLQFPTVDAARYSILGDEATFYEWLQLSPPA